MDRFTRESLFSLEIVVDRLAVPNVTCRFPSIVFRLLDYPALMIHHVEPELTTKLKRKIESDPLLRDRKQIPELLDEYGHFFQIEKGKSCLIKIAPTSLLEMLQSTPLYVMIVDNFPQVPKLIGNCTIPLDSTMTNLFEDMEVQGLAVPTVQGEKGSYGIYNLMGVEIGSITIGFRLLSLGIALMPHVPAASVAKPQRKTFELVTQKLNVKSTEDKAESEPFQYQQEHIQNDVIQPSQTQRVAQVSRTRSNLQNSMHMETQTGAQGSAMATQTDFKSRKRILQEHLRGLIAKERSAFADVTDNVIVTNTVCPPPLYYNSQVDYSHKWGLSLYEGQGDEVEEDDEWSDADTIREEDKFSDDDIDFESKPFSEVQVKKVKVPKIDVSTPRSVSKKSLPSKKHSHGSAENQLRDYPLLNALLHEIMKLKNFDHPMAVIDIPSPRRSRSKHKHLHFEKLPKSSKKGHLKLHSSTLGWKPSSPHRSHSPGRERESVDKFVERMHTPRPEGKKLPELKHTVEAKPSSVQPVKKQVHARSCKTEDHTVPSDKSWIGKLPQNLGVAKTKLLHGMTNSQRLRLGKFNQAYLRELEKEEEQRKSKWRETFTQPRGTLRVKTSKLTTRRPPKRPVPTPRLSKSQSMDISSQMQTLGLTDSSDVPHHLEGNLGTMTSTSGNFFEGTGQTDEFGTEEVMRDISVKEVQPTDKVQRRMAKPRDVVTRELLSQEVAYQSPDEDDGRARSPFQGIDVGEILGREPVIDQFSDEDSFKSAESPRSPVETVQGMKYIPPVTSHTSPVRRYTAQERVSMGSHGSFGINGSYDSTAYITQSQLPSQDSWTASPMKPGDHDPYVRSDSVSSYAPSGVNYSDETFEEDTEDHHPLDKVQVADGASLGYTCLW